ncbi:MAG: hypothetical protein PHE27_05820 [Alphaproteobacteria bacterium]|nr:hypothetical protein [Alphaproteobacteria bacterium]
MSLDVNIAQLPRTLAQKSQHLVSYSKDTLRSLKAAPYDTVGIATATAGTLLCVAGIAANIQGTEPLSFSFIGGLGGLVYGGLSALPNLVEWAKEDPFRTTGPSSPLAKAKALTNAFRLNATGYSVATKRIFSRVTRDNLVASALCVGYAAFNYGTSHDPVTLLPWAGICMISGAEIYKDALERVVYERAEKSKSLPAHPEPAPL